MTQTIPAEADPVRVAVAGREVEGVVDDVRWRPRYNATPEEATQVAVDVDGATVVASTAQLTLL
ncbi:hypothetical protein [Halorussus halobius]|uniref:hypothetical protein n=1 Tax=Halorussus halobius TaxID=1710537 RepID=UPI0010919B2B|nr:hypothetical protein [Halorussus halobius]